MKMQQTHGALPQMHQPSINPARLFALVVILGILALVLVRNFGHNEEQREMLHWQNKLGIIADDRAGDVDGWLLGQLHELAGVANNPSLQLYVTELETAKAPARVEGAPPEDPAQAVFLRNLLLITADRLGFLSRAPDPLKAIHANVHPPSGTGLAIVDNNGRILVSTDGLPTLGSELAAKVAQAPRGQSSLIDMFTTPSGETQMGFVLPIYPIQGDAVASQQIGKLVGIKTVGDDLFKLLSHPGVTESTFEVLLLRKEGDNVVYLSPSRDDKPLSQRFTLSTPSLDAAYAIGNPGSFALKRDRLSHEVLMTSRAIKDSPWVMLLHIDRDQAMAESDAWLSKMEWIMLLVLLTFVLSIIAAWWYGTSKRALLLSVQTGRLAAHSLAQEKLLRLVTDNQPEPVFIADAGNIVRFANDRAGKFFRIAAADAVGKGLSALMGHAAAAGYIDGNASALASGKPLLRTHQLEAEGRALIFRSEHIPLGHIPIDGLPYPSPGVLVVDQDVTEIVNERERRVRILRQLIHTLIRMVDERDPFAANHSASVALVAHNVAVGMGLDPLLTETADTAGNLMNIGKIVIPSEVLTRNSALGQDEVKAIRDSLSRSVALLENIEFDGPVVETLRQAGEHYDGTGPLGLKGEGILITARIIAVANAFVGMISPRSYRAAIGMEQAAKLLLEKIDTQFDRRVVVSLVNFVENKQGRELLSQLALKKVG
jgi:HD-GYP domain-containing protein (c-di-GMP phosphodiesterase class II)